MKKIYFLLLCSAAFFTTNAQVKISTPAELTATPLPDGSSMFEVKSSIKGVLIPRLSTIERDAVGTPAISLLIFNTTTDQYEYYAATPVPGWIGLARNGMNGNWSLTGNTGTTAATNFLGTIDEKSLAFRTFNQYRMLIDSAGKVGIGTTSPNSILNISGNSTSGFAFGANQFFVSLYSRPTRLNAAASNISYGLLSHTRSDNVGTYNAVAGRALRSTDTALANLTAALAHVNNPGNFQTAVLGITNSRADQSGDGQNFSAARFTDATGALNSTQDSATYTIFASSTRKNYFEGSVGVGTQFPNSRINILGNNTPGFAFGASQFFVGLYSRPTRLNTVGTNISYGLLSHSPSDNLGTYNAVAGRILRTADTSLANLTAALGHVNNPGNFQTAVLGIVNSRADQSADGQVFSAGRFTDAAGTLNATQDANTYSIFSSSVRKSYFEGNVGIGTNAPTNKLHVLATADPLRLQGLQTGLATDSLITTDGTGVLKKISPAALGIANAWNINGNAGTTAATNFLGTIDEKSLAISTFSQTRILVDSAGKVGIGTLSPNSVLNISGNSTPGFAFGANQFFVSLYSRPTRLNAAASNISYGLLSHTRSDNVGTYNAVAGRALRSTDTALANLTAALAHVNNPGNFQTAVLGITNSRADQSGDGQNFSAARFTDATGTLNSTQDSATYTIFASSTRKNYFEGSVGVGTQFPNSRINILGNSTPGFAFGANQFFVGLYSRPTRVNALASNISYGLLSHSQSDAVGTYNAVAGRILRNADTSLANLTAALGHVNNPGNFQAAVLGITNSRADQSGDGQNFSAARFTDATGTLNSTQDSATYTIFASSTRKNYFEGSVGVGTQFPNSRINILGNNTPGFAFGASQFFVGLYSRPTRLNTVGTNISYGLLSHSPSDNLGTYNAVAGRILRTADTSQANLTAALGHVNNPGNFQTAVLGIVNSRADQSADGQVFSAGRFTDAAGTLNATQDANTYSIFSSSIRKSYFEGSIGVGTNAPNSRINILGNNTAGFAFGANQFFVGMYSRPTRFNAAASEISYGLLSHSQADNLGTYNAVAGRILRTADTAQANLTAALGHVNNGGNFQTAVLGIVNSRADQSGDAQNYSAARFTVPTAATLTPAQLPNTYTVFAPDSVKSFFKGAIGVNTNAPATALDVDGGLTIRAAAVVDLAAGATFTVTVGNRSYIRISNASATALSLSNGLQTGQVLVVENSTAGAATLADAGNVNVQGAGYTFNSADDTITLMWNGARWIETARADN